MELFSSQIKRGWEDERKRMGGEGNKRNADVSTVDEKVNTASKREGKKKLK